MNGWTERFITPQFAVALIAQGIFLYAFAYDPSDATMKGAIIGGFNLALGFYLGATSTGQKAAENTGDAFRAITATANANGSGGAGKAADQVADAAADKADEIKGSPAPETIIREQTL